mmetsp:Transcript_27415/g.41733  ORF Transcript_27415/g.41733 Transcript_27415/m.41733 type:complete len:155 (-) Transcript_27415:440-904(-)
MLRIAGNTLHRSSSKRCFYQLKSQKKISGIHFGAFDNNFTLFHRKDEKRDESFFCRTPLLQSNTSINLQQRRSYHATEKKELVLYGAILITVFIGYVAVRKYRGEPIKPESATEAQEAYRLLEEEREKRNLQHRKRITIEEDSEQKNEKEINQS